MKQKLVATCLLLVLLAASIIIPVKADEVDDAQQQLNDINQKINQQQSNLNQVTRQQKSVTGQLVSIQQNISRTEADINNLDGQVVFLQTNINQTQKDIKAAETELAKKTDLLKQRLVFIYEEGQVSYLQVLLSATNIKDFLTRYDLLNNFVNSDIDLINSIDRQRLDLATKKSDLEVKKAELVNTKSNKETKKNDLSSQMADKKTLLSSIDQEKDKYKQALDELEANSRQLEQIIRSRETGGAPLQSGTGTLMWPVSGYHTITDDYGMRYHPILKTRSMHTGIDIAAPQGVSIMAADGGTVIFSGWMNAYGQAVVIDHGNGISTLYGHQSLLLVNNGDTVAKGQVIGKVGSTGWSTGPHLHFEVRQNGSPVNPHNYVN